MKLPKITLQRLRLWACCKIGHKFSTVDLIIFGVKTNAVNRDMSATITCQRCNLEFQHVDAPD